jgi:hypothetical protein
MARGTDTQPNFSERIQEVVALRDMLGQLLPQAPQVQGASQIEHLALLHKQNQDKLRLELELEQIREEREFARDARRREIEIEEQKGERMLKLVNAAVPALEQVFANLPIGQAAGAVATGPQMVAPQMAPPQMAPEPVVQVIPPGYEEIHCLNPECGQAMLVHPSQTEVSCPRCGRRFNIEYTPDRPPTEQVQPAFDDGMAYPQPGEYWDFGGGPPQGSNGSHDDQGLG